MINEPTDTAICIFNEAVTVPAVGFKLCDISRHAREDEYGELLVAHNSWG